ncbi:MAG: hypothetical protein COA79_20755 [Planctomycetota bacterium]|nr:MAG: hypothetical protein COA79_20755 [Planctomycetota bacterium]
MSPSQKAEDQYPDKIFGHKVEGFLGEGGMSKVYKVRDEEFDRVLALKVSKDMSQKALMRFVLEGKLTGQLQHPVIPPVYSLESVDGKSCHYTMKRIRGTTLKEILDGIRQKDSKLTEKYSRHRLLSIFNTICQAVAYAHTRGVIHRDIKPENIMLSEYGEIYLIDWGLAKAFGENLYANDNNDELQKGDDEATLPTIGELESSIAITLNIAFENVNKFLNEETISIEDKIDQAQYPTNLSEHQIQESDISGSTDTEREDQTIISNIDSSSEGTKQGSVFGTPLYMAPEQARGKIQLHDHRSDTYSLGVLLWDILLGTHMRAKLSTLKKKKMIQQIADGWRPSLDSKSKEFRLEPQLKGILLKATDPEQESRYQQANEISDEIQDFLEGNRKWTLVYEEDFSEMFDQDNPPTGWKALDGKWAIRNGALTTLESGNNVIHLDKSIQGDVRVEVEGYISNEINSELSIFLAASSDDSGKYFEKGYCFQYGANYRQHSKIARDGFDIAFAPGHAPALDQTHHITAELLDGNMRFEINGVNIINQRDLLPLTNDKIGLYCYSTGAYFTKLRVYSVGTPKMIGYLAVPDALFQENEFDVALEEYIRFAENHPGTAEADEATYKTIKCLIELEKYNESIPYIENLKMTPLAPLAWVAESCLVEKEKLSIQEEVQVLLDAIKHTNEHHEGLEDLSLRIQLRANDFNELDHFDAGISLLESLFQATWVDKSVRSYIAKNLCDQLVDLGYYEQAIKRVDQAYKSLGQFAVNDMINIFSSLSYSCLGQIEKSRKVYFDQGTGYIKHFSALIINSYMYCGSFSKTKDIIQRIKKQYANDEYVQINLMTQLSLAYEMEEDFVNAKNVLKNIDENIDYAKHPLNPILVLGTLEVYQGNYKQAREYYFKSSSSEIKKREKVVCIAFSYLEEGNYQKAQEVIQEALGNKNNSNRDYSGLLLEMGHFEFNCQQYDSAEVYYNKVLNDFPKVKMSCKTALIVLGRIALQKGNKDQALVYLNDSRKKYANTPTASATLWAGLIEQSKNIQGEALDSWDQLNCVGLIFYRWWSLCLKTKPNEWFCDDNGVEINPSVALSRTSINYRKGFQKMIDFKASFDPSWKDYASGIDGYINYKEMKAWHDNLPKT